MAKSRFALLALSLIACWGEPSREMQELALDIPDAQIEKLRASPAIEDIDPEIEALLRTGSLGRCAGGANPGDYCAVGVCATCFMLIGRCDEHRNCIVDHAFCAGARCHLLTVCEFRYRSFKEIERES